MCLSRFKIQAFKFFGVVFFASASSGEQSYIDLGDPVYFDAVYDTWVEVRHEIDIDNELSISIPLAVVLVDLMRDPSAPSGK